jgi:Putative Flp pilus-assembly TadE/G-like/Putative Tad-like Flp pilus-assembly
MRPPVLRRSHAAHQQSHRERGVTMVLVAVAMTAIIAMAALSIDVITLYLAREEAQRSADAAALAAARVISVSGITGTADPDTDSASWKLICGGSSSAATQAAQAVVQQNAVGGSAVAGTSTVSYLSGSGGTISSSTDCSSLSTAFAVNPIITVQIQQTGLPTFFSRIWRRTTNTVSATATAEVFNPSNSGNVGNQTTGTIIPVHPRCVKPWIIANLDPLNPGTTCTTNCQPFVSLSDGHIVHEGISLNGGYPAPNAGVIGERFILMPDCRHRTTGYCEVRDAPIQANHGTNGSWIPAPPNLEFFPGQTLNASVKIVS